jgi:hypothetical protein
MITIREFEGIINSEDSAGHAAHFCARPGKCRISTKWRAIIRGTAFEGDAMEWQGLELRPVSHDVTPAPDSGIRFRARSQARARSLRRPPRDPDRPCPPARLSAYLRSIDL